jgi:hypothetical protein
MAAANSGSVGRGKSMLPKDFLKNTDETGRFVVTSVRTGKSYAVEAIGNGHAADWGDMDPATKKLTGNYGNKYTGSVRSSESLINESNFVNIKTLPIGESPFSYIEKLDSQYPTV